MVSIPYQEQRRLMVVTEARQTEDGSPHRMVIAANELSRNGDELNLRGVSFKNYRKNPVVLWAHDAYEGIPIAKTLKIGHDEQGRIEADFQFNSGDEFAARVENAWNNGFIRSASIRYLPTKVVEVRNEEGKVERLRIEESELLEWSLVPIPADPDAVKAGARALNLPEEIFRGFEAEQDVLRRKLFNELRSEFSWLLRGGDVGLSGPPSDPGVDRIEELTKRVENLKGEVKELVARDSTTEKEPKEAPESDEQEDGELVAVGKELAAIRRIIEEK